MPHKRWGQQIALVTGSHSSVRSYCLHELLKPVRLAGRRAERDPLHPAMRPGLSPSAWEGVPKALPSYSFYCSLGRTGWLALPCKMGEKEEMTREYLLWGPSGLPFWPKLAPRLIIPPVFPCCWLWPPTSASCKVHIRALPSQNPE